MLCQVTMESSTFNMEKEKNANYEQRQCKDI